MRANAMAIKFLAGTTALFAPNAALPQEASVSPAADTEYFRNWGVPMINALPAYLEGHTGKGIVVAIVDTGLDVDHPELAQRISEAVRNFGSDKASDDVSHSLDDNGAISGHGTHVAGIIGAARNGMGMQGVAYEATILPLRAIDVDVNDDKDPANEAIRYAAQHGAQVLNGSYGPSWLLKPYLQDENGKPILDGKGETKDNPHYQKLEYQPIYDSVDELRDTYNAIRTAAENDIVLIFAAGNDAEEQAGKATAMPSGNGMYPLITPANTRNGLYRLIDTSKKGFDLNNPNTYAEPTDPSFQDLDFSDLKGSLIAVVAINREGKISSYSNRCGAAAEWCLAAPGGEDPDKDPSVAIFSTWPGGGYKPDDGTSMAAPHVAGAAAVVRSGFPYMNARQTIETILTTATDIGREEIYGQGLLNLGAAVGGPMEFRYPGVFDVDTQGYSSIWSNPISGPGDLTKRGEGALVLSGDNSTYAGPTRIVGGTLAVDGSIASQVHVSGMGTLAGIGTVGPLAAAEGGAVAPGSVLDPAKAAAVLTVDGDFAQQAGSLYQAGIGDGDRSDLIQVAGKATIDSGSHMEIMREGTAFSVNTRHTLLAAKNGVSGSYGGLVGSFATETPFVDFGLDYDPTRIYLDVSRNDTAFAEVGNTFNRRSIASAAEALGDGSVIHDRILFLTVSEARKAFDLLSGEIHASSHGALIEESHFVRDAANERIRAAFEGVAASSLPVTAYGPDGVEMASANDDRLTIWGYGFGSWGHLDGDGNAARLDRSSGGFMAGGDALVGEQWRVGLLAGYSHTSFDVDERASSGSSNNYHLGLYMGTQHGNLGFRSGLAYTWHRIKTDRSVAFPGFSDSLSAAYDAATFQAFGELGYRMDTAWAAFEPYANLAYVKFNADGFSENGGAAALSSADRSSDATVTTLGLRASCALTLSRVEAIARGMVGWRHAFGDVTPETKLAYAGGSSFSVKGTPIAKNAAVIEAGLDMNLTETATLGLTYQGQLAPDAQEHGFNAKLAIRF